jgi:cysteine-rich repeat protein
VRPGEQCDDGNQNQNDACKNNCTLNVCGDQIVNPAAEECDDGNTVNNDGCTNACRLPACGDGIVQTGEECDDGTAQQ